jgi:hypothetical protein
MFKRLRAGPGNFPTDTMLYNSAYVITLLGLFLRLENYAQLLTRMDRLKAKRLIRLALDIRTVETSCTVKSFNCVNELQSPYFYVAATARIATLRPRPSARISGATAANSSRIQPALPPPVTRYNLHSAPAGVFPPPSSSTSMGGGGMFPPPPYCYQKAKQLSQSECICINLRYKPTLTNECFRSTSGIAAGGPFALSLCSVGPSLQRLWPLPSGHGTCTDSSTPGTRLGHH